MMICVQFTLHVQAYANNQHKIADEMLTNPFLKAMSICKGTVSILDAGCVVYSRIWCIFELFKSVMGDNSNYEFDVYTEIDGDKGAVGITHGLVPIDMGDSFYKRSREYKFPLNRILQATNVDIKQAQASVESDRKFILNTITGRSEDDSVLDDHSNYDKLNDILRGIFVAPALQRIIEEMDVDTITRCLEIVKVSNARIIDLDLKDCSRFNDSILIKLADSLPPLLTELKLCNMVGDVVIIKLINAFLGKIRYCLTLVELDLNSNNIDADGAKQIADALKVSHSLRTLDLSHNNIGDVGAQVIADALNVNHSLETLILWDNNLGVEGAKAIADALKVNHSLKRLNLVYNNLGDDGAKQIADALKNNHSLEFLSLNVNNIGDDGAKQIADVLQFNVSLKTLQLYANKIDDDGRRYLSKIKQELKDINRDIDIDW